MQADLPDFLAQYDPTWLAGMGIVAALVVGLLIVAIFKLRNPTAERLIEKAIKELSDDYVKDMVLSDGMYGYHFIDYVVLFPGKIVIIDVEHYEGYIFGGEKIEEWAQVVNNRSFNFDNPVIKAHHCVQALKAIAADVEIVGKVVFASECSFPKGVPPGVIELPIFKTQLAEIKAQGPADPTLRQAWERILDTSKQHKSQYKAELKVA
jgi:hypothetical protein